MDREVDHSLELVITAEDHGTTPLITRVTMTITLLDENDNIPTFVPQFGYAVIAPEDTAVGSVLITAVSLDTHTASWHPSSSFIFHSFTLSIHTGGH